MSVLRLPVQKDLIHHLSYSYKGCACRARSRDCPSHGWILPLGVTLDLHFWLHVYDLSSLNLLFLRQKQARAFIQHSHAASPYESFPRDHSLVGHLVLLFKLIRWLVGVMNRLSAVTCLVDRKPSAVKVPNQTGPPTPVRSKTLVQLQLFLAAQHKPAFHWHMPSAITLIRYSNTLTITSYVMSLFSHTSHSPQYNSVKAVQIMT
ncbi:hypothetical protein BJY01DRAFT_10685 [Aspergillus pseudoustus]|uniref:Uncharacterized protein n=1 Tax=Aspergillus pseudoustus TaxID=1810923 RepID=A0ABR4KSR5_9EURO